MSIVICAGIHDPEFTQSFLAGLKTRVSCNSNFSQLKNLLIFPAPDYSALSAFHILQFLSESQVTPGKALVFISFSAGVVGAIGAAWGWQLLGGKVKALIALDGWGVPLFGNFPIYRLSHDDFTHYSSSLLGSGEDSFYADPATQHLDLWRSPQTTTGWWVHPSRGQSPPQTYLTAAEFLIMLLERHGECNS